MIEQYRKWYSQYLSRDFEMLIFGHSGQPIVLFPTSQGRYYDNKDNGLIAAVSSLLDEGRVKIYCPDGIDNASWYNSHIHPADRIKTYLGYEDLIVNDVLGYIREDLRKESTILAGCSLGAYYAMNIALKYPQFSSGIVCMGGTYDIKPYMDDYYDDFCYYNNPVDYLPGLNDRRYLDDIRKMKIYLGTGDKDICLDENMSMSSILYGKQINHKLEVIAGSDHHWYWWRGMFYNFLTNEL